jgi:TRAP-type C4-dicarboxylate transport system substrate-binding protein
VSTGRRIAAAVALGALPLVAPACAGAPGKSGGRESVELRLAVPEYRGKPAARIAERFAKRVEALSHGSMRVSIAYWPSRFAPTTATRLVQASAVAAVRSNAVQLGVVPASAFRDQGVRSLDALQAPFVIASYALAARTARSPVATRLQAGLAGVGLAGVGLVPEAMLRPFGYLKPLETPSDFAHLRVRASYSRATYDLLRTLGAEPVDLNAENLDTAVNSGFAEDAESLTTAREQFPKDAFTAGNVAFFPKDNVVVVNGDVLGHLSSGGQALLRRAAAQTRDETIAATDEGADAAAFCRAGGTVVTAPDSALRALRAKAAPLLAAMRRDPATRSLIGAIERLGPARGAPLRPCASTTAATVAGPTFPFVTDSESMRILPPIGSYRRVFTVSALRSAGAGAAAAQDDQGVATLTFEGPCCILRFAVAWRGPAERPACRGIAAPDDGLVGVRWNPATPCSGYLAFGWRPHGRDLTIVTLDRRTRPAWIRKAWLGTWKRVDCTPSLDYLTTRHRHLTHPGDRSRPC